jgi:hypothetical protein
LRAFGAGATDCAALLLLFSATARFFTGCPAAIFDVPVFDEVVCLAIS